MSSTLTSANSVENQDAINHSNSRLAGFDIGRGIAAFCVIFIHSGGMFDRRMGGVASWFDTLFTFAVPYFLLTSFYFASSKDVSGAKVKSAVQARLRRLLVPYCIWCSFYYAVRIMKFYTLTHKLQLIDPVGALMGGTGVQMYFLPLLSVGLAALLALNERLRHLNLSAIAALFCLSAAIQAVILCTANAYYQNVVAFGQAVHLGRGVLSGCLRIVLILAAHLLRCLPLIFLIYALRRLLPANPDRRAIAAAATSGIFFLLLRPIFSKSELVGCINDEALGMGSFLIAWSLSFLIPTNARLSSIGECSFGIFLSHFALLEVVQAILKSNKPFAAPTDFTHLLAFSALIFVLCYIIVLNCKNKGSFVALAMGFSPA